MLLNKSIKMFTALSNQTQKEWVGSVLSESLTCCHKYCAAETVKGKAGSNRWITVFTFNVCWTTILGNSDRQ